MAHTDDDTYDRLFFEFDAHGAARVVPRVLDPALGQLAAVRAAGRHGPRGSAGGVLPPRQDGGAAARAGAWTTLDDYLRELLARKTSPNGVFGTKAHWGQYQPLFGEADPRRCFPTLRAGVHHPPGQAAPGGVLGAGAADPQVGTTRTARRWSARRSSTTSDITQKLGADRPRGGGVGVAVRPPRDRAAPGRVRGFRGGPGADGARGARCARR